MNLGLRLDDLQLSGQNFAFWIERKLTQVSVGVWEQGVVRSLICALVGRERCAAEEEDQDAPLSRTIKKHGISPEKMEFAQSLHYM